MKLYENERCDEVNDSLSLIQKTDGLTFGTDALLLAGYIGGKYKKGMELGGGSGIISMLLLTRGKIDFADCVEVQNEYALLIERNAELNSLSERMKAIHADVRNLKKTEEYDILFTNPPYMKNDSGKNNQNDKKAIARHEIFGDISDFCDAARGLLKYGGAFFAVYRPDRLSDIVCAMRNSGIEPKRMTFVHADINSESSMVLIEGKRGAKSGMQLTNPLIIYRDKEHRQYTEDMDYIMENGSFPDRYKR